MSPVITDAGTADLPGILAIYNDAVLNTTAIWNESEVDLANRQAWLNERNAAGFPVLVARAANGDVLGYASYGTWRSIEGFRHTVEHSVYVRADQRGQGLGPLLMQALIARAANGDVLGYASYGTWRSIEGFRHTVEHSVYVRADQRGQGLGPLLMQALIARARSAGLHVLVAAIETQNLASIRLHERLGFSTSGQMPQVGRKFGRWLDLTFMQLILE